MPDLPDLDELREKAEKATRGPWKQDLTVGHFLVLAGQETLASTRYSRDAAYIDEASPDVILAVLALVDTLQGEVERLRDALLEFGGHAPGCHIYEQTMRLPCTCDWPETLAALSVSPAEKTHP